MVFAVLRRRGVQTHRVPLIPSAKRAMRIPEGEGAQIAYTRVGRCIVPVPRTVFRRLYVLESNLPN